MTCGQQDLYEQQVTQCLEYRGVTDEQLARNIPEDKQAYTATS